MEIITEPVPAESPLLPPRRDLVVGAVAPASPDPIPIVLFRTPSTGCAVAAPWDTHVFHWRLERRKSARPGEDDE